MLRNSSFFAAILLSMVIVGTQSASAAPPDRAAYNYYGYNQRPQSARVERYFVTPVRPAPMVAASPTERRAFSLEPQVPQPTEATRLAPVRRSFSYEPSAVMVSPSYRTRKPAFLLPKTDPAKFR